MEAIRIALTATMHRSISSSDAVTSSALRAPPETTRDKYDRPRQHTVKSSRGFGMVSAMLLLVIVGLLATWIGNAVMDHGRRLTGERIGVEISALRDLMQTFVDLHGPAVKDAFFDSANPGLIKIKHPVQPDQVIAVPVTKASDKDYLEFTAPQIVKVAEALGWKNHAKGNSEAPDYFARVRVRLGNGTCEAGNKDKCTLQMLVIRKESLTFLDRSDTIAVLAAMKTIGNGAGASVSIGTSDEATHFRFPPYQRHSDDQNAFFSNPSKKPGAVAALSDRAASYQPFLRRDGGTMEATLNMNQKNIDNAAVISGATEIRAIRKLVVGNETDESDKWMKFEPKTLSSNDNITVTSPQITFRSSTDASKVVSIKEGLLQADSLSVKTLTAAAPVQFHRIAKLGDQCIGSQISFTTEGEPAYCQATWQRLRTTVVQDCPPCPKPPPPPPPPEGKRQPLFKEGTMKWMAHSAKLTFPFGEPAGRRSVFFLGKEWHSCSVVIDHTTASRSNRYYDRSDLVALRRSKFRPYTNYNSDLMDLGKEASWQMLTHRPASTVKYSHEYTVTCYRPAILGSDNHWHMASLPPQSGDFAKEGENRDYRHPEFHRIERLYLTPHPNQ